MEVKIIIESLYEYVPVLLISILAGLANIMYSDRNRITPIYSLIITAVFAGLMTHLAGVSLLTLNYKARLFTDGIFAFCSSEILTVIKKIGQAKANDYKHTAETVLESLKIKKKE